MIPEINDRLSTLALIDSGLIGCRRRGKWSLHEETPWRFARGNALLEYVGSRDWIETPHGFQEYYTLDDNLIVYRGGPWNLDWIEDMYDLWVLVYDMRKVAISKTIYVLHENKGDIDIKRVEVPETLHPNRRLTKMVTEFTSEPPGRIPKSGPRAIRICPHCPHKQRCDAEDILQGQTDDWSPSYPQP